MNIGDTVGMSKVTNTYNKGAWEVIELDGERAEVIKDTGTRKVLWASWNNLTVSRISPFDHAVNQVDKVVGE